jgi:HlyD family secretion protein
MKHPYFLLSIPLVVGLSAVAVRISLTGRAKEGETQKTAQAGSAASVSPDPAAAGAGGAESVAARALGKLESLTEEIGVASDITGRIVKILVDEGDPVEVGQPLAQLDETYYGARVAAYQAAVEAAKARKARLTAGARVESIRKAQAVLDEEEAMSRIARDRANRADRLGQNGILSGDEADWFRRDAEARDARVRASREELTILQNETRPEDLAAAAAELLRAQEELAAGKAELDKTVIRSPIRGTVVRRNLRVGEAVSSFQVEPVITVADLSRLRVRAEVDEIDIGKVRLGQIARAESDSFPGLILNGRVVRLGKTMGRKSVKSMNPNERQDVRVREVLIELDSAVDLPLGLRLVVTFLDAGPAKS